MKRVYIEYKVKYSPFEAPELHTLDVDVPDLPLIQFVDWIREDKPSPGTAEHARHVVEIIKSAHLATEIDNTQEFKARF